jgi:hypothetical protein
MKQSFSVSASICVFCGQVQGDAVKADLLVDTAGGAGH